MLRYLFNLGLVFSRWSRLYMWIRRVVRRKSILGNILFSLYPTYQKYKSFIITYRLHLFVLSIVETVNKYISNPDVIKRSKTYWILHRSLVIVCHYGRVKTIWGRTFAWPAIFQGKKGTTGEQSKSASQIRDVWPCWITKISCSLWVQSKASVWIKQKIWWAELSPCCSSFYLVEFPHSVSFNFERLHFN